MSVPVPADAPDSLTMMRRNTLSLVCRLMLKPRIRGAAHAQAARFDFEMRARLAPPPPFWRARMTHEIMAGGGGKILAEWMIDAQAPADGGVILHLHGGGYALGSPRTHRGVAWALARETGARICTPDYRLAPENRFPAALEDALAIYRKLLETTSPERIAFAGDSAGGGLALAVILEARRLGLPAPAALALFSPWTDLTLSGESFKANAESDPVLPAERAEELVDLYAQGLDLKDPLLSPLFGDFAGAPPMLIQCSDIELIRDDSTRLVERLQAMGVKAHLDLWRGLPHAWQVAAPVLPEANEALARAGAWLKARLAAG